MSSAQNHRKRSHYSYQNAVQSANAFSSRAYRREKEKKTLKEKAGLIKKMFHRKKAM